MTRRLVVTLIVAALLLAPSAAAQPVFDCTKAEVRRAHPAQCPELPDPLLGGGNTGGGGGQCGGLCGIVRGVLNGLGLGGIL